MSVYINTNVDSFAAQRNLGLVGADYSKMVQRLSSGLRINSAADDAAGLAISQKLQTQITGYSQAGRNAQDSISMLQTGDSALNTTQSILQRMRELSVQAANDTYTSTDRANIQTEINQLIQEVNRISQQTNFNTKKLLDGSAGGAIVTGGGPDVKGVVAQAGVAVNGTFTLASKVAATKSAVEAGTVATGSTFTTSSSITITGGLGTATFTAQAGETLATFFQQVNGSGIGVTMSVDNSASVGRVLIANNNYGLYSSTVNATGVNAVTVANSTGDFGATGLSLLLTTASAMSGAIISGTFASGSTASNAVVMLTSSAGGVPTPATVTATGLNSDTVTGSGLATGLTITLSNPGVLTGGDLIAVTQNAALQMQIGANAGQTIGVSIGSVNSTALGVASLDVLTQTDASTAISQLDAAIQQVSSVRATLGALQNRLTNAMNNDSSAQQNALSSNMMIQDTNIAATTVQFTRDQILLQAGTSVLAQANQSPAGFLKLLP